eukprot:7864335-Pyramimonas_sp.AAC.1
MPHRASTAHSHCRISEGKAAAMSMGAKMGTRAPALGSVLESPACMSTCATVCRNWRPRTNPFCSSDVSFA